MLGVALVRVTGTAGVDDVRGPRVGATRHRQARATATQRSREPVILSQKRIEPRHGSNMVARAVRGTRCVAPVSSRNGETTAGLSISAHGAATFCHPLGREPQTLMYKLLAELRDTLARWTADGRTDDGETPIDGYGRRVLSMVDRYVIGMEHRAQLGAVLFERGTGRTPAGRAALLGIVNVLRRCSSWPFGSIPAGDATRLQLMHPYDMHVPVDGSQFAQLAAIVERELDDWALIVSDGIVHAVCATQGRAVLTADTDDTVADVADVVGRPPAAGLWVYWGRYTYRDDARSVSDGEGMYPVFPGNYRPATPQDLRLLDAFELWDWIEAFDDYDGEQLRRVVVAMHAPECPQYEEAAALPEQPGLADNEARLRAREMRLTDAVCRCTQYAQHEPADVPPSRLETIGGLLVEPPDSAGPGYRRVVGILDTDDAPPAIDEHGAEV